MTVEAGIWNTHSEKTRRVKVRLIHFTRITDDHSRRNIERTAESESEVSKVAANA